MCEPHPKRRRTAEEEESDFEYEDDHPGEQADVHFEGDTYLPGTATFASQQQVDEAQANAGSDWGPTTIALASNMYVDLPDDPPSDDEIELDWIHNEPSTPAFNPVSSPPPYDPASSPPPYNPTSPAYTRKPMPDMDCNPQDAQEYLY